MNISFSCIFFKNSLMLLTIVEKIILDSIKEWFIFLVKSKIIPLRTEYIFSLLFLFDCESDGEHLAYNNWNAIL